jgi:hypothetical protein
MHCRSILNNTKTRKNENIAVALFCGTFTQESATITVPPSRRPAVPLSRYRGHNHPNVPAVTRPYTNPSNTPFQVTFQGFPIQIDSGICPAP